MRRAWASAAEVHEYMLAPNATLASLMSATGDYFFIVHITAPPPAAAAGAGGGILAVVGFIPPELLLAQKAMFGLLDRRSHPIGCGFFVSESGIALTVHHDINSWSTLRAGKRIVEACKLDRLWN